MIFLGFKKEYKSLQMASKKVYFLTVWAAQNKEDLEGLARVVDIEYGNTTFLLYIHAHIAAYTSLNSIYSPEAFL